MTITHPEYQMPVHCHLLYWSKYPSLLHHPWPGNPWIRESHSSVYLRIYIYVRYEDRFFWREKKSHRYLKAHYFRHLCLSQTLLCRVILLWEATERLALSPSHTVRLILNTFLCRLRSPSWEGTLSSDPKSFWFGSDLLASGSSFNISMIQGCLFFFQNCHNIRCI